MQRFEYSYDKNTDDLLLFRSKTKSSGSIEVSNDIIFDYNSKKEFVGMQLLNASKIIKDFRIDENEGINLKRFLSSLVECKVKYVPKGNYLFIKIYLFSSHKQEIVSSFSIPQIIESSPALACV